MNCSTSEESAARSAELWEGAERDMERLAEQCCDEFHGESGTFQDFVNDRDRTRWREFARYLWGCGARPMSEERKTTR